MVENSKREGGGKDPDILFLPMYDLEREERRKFCKRTLDSMNVKCIQDGFSYEPDAIAGLYDYAIRGKTK